MEFRYKDEVLSSVVGGDSTENSYSEDEQLIGTWTDGKPLYRRVFITRSPADQSESQISYPDSSMVVVAFEGYLGAGSGYVTKIPCALNSASDNSFKFFSYYVDNGGKTIRLRTNNTGWMNNTTKLFLEYTKTTD